MGMSMLLDYRLVDAPNFTNSYLESFHKGEFFDKADPKEAPFLPHPLPNPSTAPRMVTFWVSDYVFSTFVFVVEKYGLLNHTITNEDMKKLGHDGLLNTTCPGKECIGKFIPELSRRYPNCSVIIDMRSAGEEKQPQFSILPEHMEGFVSGSTNFIAKRRNGTEIPLFDVMVNLSLSMNSYIEKQRVKAKITSSSIKMKVIHSNIGPISQLMIETIFKVVTKFWVIPHINELGSQGFPLPPFEKVEFVNSTLKMDQGALQISTDLQREATLYYRPDAGPYKP
ncbi:hypothetical protein LSAT2_028646 [Lamellibrachia satsuma]|nr:hypothetical protein LSAT2_028646 [Lamellibrachia satsuma]